jgi:hypothetical protein
MTVSPTLLLAFVQKGTREAASSIDPGHPSGEFVKLT